MDIVLVGYGRMGKEIEAVCLERGHRILHRIDPLVPGSDSPKLEARHLEKAQGVIEFALAADFEANSQLYIAHRVPTVVGTTGWQALVDQTRDRTLKAGATMLHGSNFSLGAHIMFNLVRQAATMINKLPQYDIMVHEYHHKLKEDSPSGTALSLARDILDRVDRKTEIQARALEHRRIQDHELHVSSTRGGRYFGIHQVDLDSSADTIEIRHTAHGRQGLATGAVLAMEWLAGRSGFFTVDDFVRDQFLA